MMETVAAFFIVVGIAPAGFTPIQPAMLSITPEASKTAMPGVAGAGGGGAGACRVYRSRDNDGILSSLFDAENFVVGDDIEVAKGVVAFLL